MAVWIVFAVCLRLVLSQDTTGLCKVNSFNDSASLVQLQAKRQLKTCVSVRNNMCLTEFGDRCDQYCAECDLAAMKSIAGVNLTAFEEPGCDGVGERDSPVSPQIESVSGVEICLAAVSAPTCEAQAASNSQRVCVCATTTTTTTWDGQLKTCVNVANNMCLTDFGGRCDRYCAQCDLAAMKNITGVDLTAFEEPGCDGVGERDSPVSPQIESVSGVEICLAAVSAPTCEAQAASNSQRVCVCAATAASTTVSGSDVGDPHIQTLRGARYTLLREGVFVAWSFSKVPAVDWQLLAAYGGRRFSVKGLLLLDHGSRGLELMAEDCAWRSKEEQEWRFVGSELLVSEDGATSVQIQKLEQLGASTVRSSVLLQVQSKNRARDVAKLIVHCAVPQRHIDFKVVMFQKDDMDHIGGELGASAFIDQKTDRRLSTRRSLMGVSAVRDDREFKVQKSWSELGGRVEGAAYLKSQQDQPPNLLQTSCDEAQQDMAQATCSKYFSQNFDFDFFMDCVFDVCHGGDESFAQSAAALLSA